MELTNDALDSWDRAHLVHPLTALGAHERGESGTRILTTGQGVYLEDRNGKRTIDAFSGLFCVNVGYGRTEIAEAIAEQARKLAYSHAYFGNSTEAGITLSHMIAERAPHGFKHVYFGLSGSDANETNFKLAWYYNNLLGRPQKKKVISRWRAYHGAGIVSGSLTGLPIFHSAFDLPISAVRHTLAPCYYDRAIELSSMSEEEFSQYCADQLDALIDKEGADTVAAFIAEPVMGTGGIVPPPKGYWPRMRSVLRKHDVLMLVDEVVTGFGRLGEMFGSTVYDLDPDFISIAKGLTSAYAPLSGSLIHDRIWKVISPGSDKLGAFGHGTTFSAHPISAAAGIANLKLVDEMDLVANARLTGAYLLAALKDAFAEHPMVGEVRGKGMLTAVEFVEDKAKRQLFKPEHRLAGKVVAEMFSLGVVARAMPQTDVLGLCPALCLTRAEADVIVDTAKKALAQVVTKFHGVRRV